VYQGNKKKPHSCVAEECHKGEVGIGIEPVGEPLRRTVMMMVVVVENDARVTVPYGWFQPSNASHWLCK
jgi:hypothetical protein